MFKSLFRSGRKLLEANEQLLVGEWVSASPFPDLMRDYVDNLTSVRRVKPRGQVLLHRSKSKEVPYPSLHREPGALSVMGIRYRLGGSNGVATCAVSEGRPDTLTGSVDIWGNETLEVVSQRSFEPVLLSASRALVNGVVPMPLRLFSSETGQQIEIISTSVGNLVEDYQWLLDRPLPPQLQSLIRDVGILRIGDLQFCKTPEIFVYPELVCLPVCAFEDGRFVVILPIRPAGVDGIGIVDQVFQGVRYFGDDLEAAMAELVRVQRLEPEDCPFED